LPHLRGQGTRHFPERTGIMAKRGWMNTPAPLEIGPRELKQRLDAGEAVQLIDVRDPREYTLARWDGAERIPLRAIPKAVATLRERAAGGPLVFFCHHGARSLQTVSWLRRMGVNGCVSLYGGIDLWSAAIDPAVPRY
jgi:rhodanese-related sulfurtransferase